MKILVSAFMLGLLLVAGAAWLGASEESLWVIVFLVLIYFFVGLFVYKIFKNFFLGSKQRTRINKSGELVQAIILSVKPSNVWVGNGPEIIMELKIHETDGSFYLAKVRGTVLLTELPVYQPGKLIDVVRDRETGHKWY